MKIGINKRCPRCNTKMPIAYKICPSCQLNFDKFELATNLEAKEAIRQGETDRVLMRKSRPIDVKFWKLFLVALFTGFMGGHLYYVGRKKQGIFYTIFFVIGVTNGLITSLTNTVMKGGIWEIFTLLVLTWGAVIAMWIIDLAKICLNKFKIPVSRDN